jgi:hypothetical protein
VEYLSLDSASLVLAGDAFPVASVDPSDLSFGSVPLKQNTAIPSMMAVVAEGPDVVLQVLPNRIEINVKRVTNLESHVKNVAGLVDQLFDFVGPRTIKAVGHNAQKVFSGIGHEKLKVIEPLLNISTCAEAIGGTPLAADLQLYFSMADDALGRVSFLTGQEEKLGLDFNAHYEVGKDRSASDAVAHFKESLDRFAGIVNSAAKVLGI